MSEPLMYYRNVFIKQWGTEQPIRSRAGTTGDSVFFVYQNYRKDGYVRSWSLRCPPAVLAAVEDEVGRSLEPRSLRQALAT
jgi:hypothetical protein